MAFENNRDFRYYIDPKIQKNSIPGETYGIELLAGKLSPKAKISQTDSRKSGLQSGFEWDPKRQIAKNLKDFQKKNQLMNAKMVLEC